VIEVAVLEELAEIFASLRDVDVALGRFLELARAIAGSSFGAVYLRDEARGEFRRWSESAETPALHLGIALVEATFAAEASLRVALDDPRFDGVPAIVLSRAGGIHAALGLALRHGDKLVGVLGLGFPSLDVIPEAALRTLVAVARFPAAAIEHARTQELSERRARLADLLRRFGERALATVDEGGLHTLILDTTVLLTGADQASITHVRNGRVRVIAGVGKDAALVGTEAPVEAMSEALSVDEPYVVADTARSDGSKLLVKLARRHGAGSFMALAMRHQARVFGHLFAGAAEPHCFRDEEVEAMRILSSMAAAVLEQHSAQAEAELQARRLAATVEQLPICIELFDGGGQLVLGNATARALRRQLGVAAGTAADPLPGCRIHSLDGQLLPQSELPSARALRGEQPEPCEIVIDSPDEQKLTLQMAAAPIFGADGRALESVVVACLDVTTLHVLAQEKDRFLRVAAHELRTPLTALHTTTQLIEVDPDAFDNRERRDVVLARIRRQSTRLMRLVEQLLDSVRVQSGELVLRRAEVDLVALCRGVVDTVLPRDTPRVLICADAAVVGRWDPLRIEQVVTNLLSNAARYGSPGGEVTLRVGSDGGRAILSVSDEGIGIPAHQLAQLFTPFFRGANAQQGSGGGLGLGLHIAQEIVRRHGGVIRVESRENAGTTVTVELPLD
jgi:signal transduction histidine kinase